LRKKGGEKEYRRQWLREEGFLLRRGRSLYFLRRKKGLPPQWRNGRKRRDRMTTSDGRIGPGTRFGSSPIKKYPNRVRRQKEKEGGVLIHSGHLEKKKKGRAEFPARKFRGALDQWGGRRGSASRAEKARWDQRSRPPSVESTFKDFASSYGAKGGKVHFRGRKTDGHIPFKRF